jgi:hypothetical protein
MHDFYGAITAIKSNCRRAVRGLRHPKRAELGRGYKNDGPLNV